MTSQVFSGFVALHQLTSLEIDLVDIQFERTPVHLCDSISQLIPNLKRLRCRLSRICDGILATQPRDLEELIINLSASRRDGHPPRHCSGKLSQGLDELQTGLETRLVELVANMHNPKRVRLIICWLGYGRPFVFDAIEQQWRILELGSAWDADGLSKSEYWKHIFEEEDNDDDEDTEVEDGNEDGEVIEE